MKYLIYLILILLLPFSSPAQTSKYFIEFTDKNNSPYSVTNPSAFLSQRAITRRIMQGIAIEDIDLPVNPAYVDSVISKGANVFTRSKWFNGITIEADMPTLQAVLTLPFVQQSTQINNRPASSGVGQDSKRNKFYLPLDSHINDMPRTQTFNYGSSYTQIHIMNGDYLHDAGFHGEDKVIALLDAGFYHANVLPAFDSLNANNQILGTWDFVANEASVYEDYWHGMSVLSTIGGNLPGELVGTAPKASFWLLRTEEFATEYLIEEYNWDAGAEFADSAGADIISSSLGYNTFNDPTQNHTYADMNGHTTPSARAANMAFSKGMLVIVSAGNDGGSSWQYISSPADADSAMAVGAVNGSGIYAGFSSTGPSSDGDIKPNVAAVGQGTIISYSNGATGPGSGTSFSCPVLAGSAACLWQAYPTFTNKAIFNAIQQSASQHLNPDSLLGYGIPDFMMADRLLGGIDHILAAGYDPVSVYPNPFVHDVKLKFYSEKRQTVTIRIFDVPGKKLMERNVDAVEKTFNSIPLSLDQLQKGIYFMEVSVNGTKIIRKIIKA